MLTRTQKLFLIVTAVILIALSVPFYLGHQIIEFDPHSYDSTTIAHSEFETPEIIIHFDTEFDANNEDTSVSRPLGPPPCIRYGCYGIIIHYESDWRNLENQLSHAVEPSRCHSPTCGGDPIRA